MNPYYIKEPSRVRLMLRWLLPTTIDIFLYGMITVVTVVLSNIRDLNSYLFIPAHFSLKTAVLGSIQSLLTHVVGERAAATLVTAVFWGLIGMMVYIGLWLLSNFSTELGNDLAITKYAHAGNADTYSPLKDMVWRIIFHVVATILLAIYVDVLVGAVLPLATGNFSRFSASWHQPALVSRILLAAIIEIAGLHILTVLMRLSLLKKRVFGD